LKTDFHLFAVLAAPINVHYVNPYSTGSNPLPATQQQLHSNVDKTNVVDEAAEVGTRIQMFSQLIS